jgi:hypothetical protein
VTIRAEAVEAKKYRLVDEHGYCCGEWSGQGGETTLLLRDGNAIPRLALQVSQQTGGSISWHDGSGAWQSRGQPKLCPDGQPAFLGPRPGPITVEMRAPAPPGCNQLPHPEPGPDTKSK